MFDILLSDQTHHPLYMQLYMQIRQHIRSGVIANGARLPSVRSLQLHLNISKTPIETAFQMLSAEGYVVSKPRSGLFAVNPHEIGSTLQNDIDSSQHLQDLQPSLRAPLAQSYRIDFNPAAVDKDMFPIRTWRKMLHEVLESFADDIGQYGDPHGEYAFRRILADYLRNSRGVVCAPEQIVIGSGISHSIYILTKLLSGVEHVAFEEPGYETVREQFLLHGFKLIPITIHDKGLSLEELEKSKAQTVYTTPSHQFPTGSIIPYAERTHLLDWANARNAYIIEDDYDGEFRYIGKPIPSLQSLDQHGRVIYIGTFSKAFTPALRMNYMVLPMNLVKKLAEIHLSLLSPSRIDQWAMQAFIEKGHWYRHIRKMRNTYRKKHHRFIQLLHMHFADYIDITGHSAGLHIQVTVKTHLNAQTLLKLAANDGVRVYNFQQMWMNQNETGYPKIYLGFAGISEQDMERGVLLLRKAWGGILV
ncbi:PLP-dependent aminotransferase family protein [Paenibacillus sp. GCM10027628]|uniref:MocR-like pyridoxine biosynthesis transcription factor PdxR n=1 Tax=Paenibacillus sp. GCM10027628 TaxID=3273413 RepID=UPI003629AEBA